MATRIQIALDRLSPPAHARLAALACISCATQFLDLSVERRASS